MSRSHPVQLCAPSNAVAAGLSGLGAMLLAVVLAAVASAAGAARFDFDAAGGRLPKDVRPVHYRLALDVDPASPRFRGSVDVDIDVRRPVDAIVLNAHKLEAAGAVLADASGVERPLMVTPDAPLQQWRLAPASGEGVAAGRYRMRIDFAGSVERVGQGLFVVDYVAEGHAARMLATQLQPGHARKVFPGFDEPAFRARFELTARAPERYEVVSNMPATGSKVAAGTRETKFAATPPMPAYLFAIAVGEFDALVDRQDGVDLRILTARGKRDHAQYAMEVTKQVLPFFRDYFDRPYMLPKLDQLAIPGVRWGAMEDWGAISYNEALLLFDPARSTPRTRLLVYNIVAHEIAHQWFGNLVTAGWWDDLWLNEAFATWMARKASERFNPQWKLAESERTNKEEAMRRDAGGATRPIVVPVASESEAFGVFDEITYQKGGSVLSMFEAAMGEDAFRDGLRRYIRDHAYGNASADDLWYHLSRAAGRDVTAAIGGWVKRPGFPVLDVAARCDGRRTHVRLTQRRFSSTNVRELVSMWQVPVTLSAGNATRALTLGREPGRATFPGCVAVVANAGDTGYYRVRYDAAALSRLRRAFATLPAIDRAAITADTHALAASGAAPLVDYLDLVALPVRRTASEWLLIVESLARLDRTLAESPAQPVLRAWARDRLAPELERLEWQPAPQDDLAQLRLRGALIDALGQFDHVPTIERARRMHAEGSSDPSTVAGILNTVARHADARTFEALLAARKAARGQEESIRLERALTLPRDPALVRRVLELSLGDEWEPRAATWLATHVGPNSGHTALAFEFVERNYDALAAKAADWGRPWLLPSAAAGFNERSRADALIAAQRARVGDAGRDAAGQIAQVIRENAAIREREGNRLASQLHARSQRPTANAPAERRT